MPTREELCLEADSWVGTPWGHQQSIKGLACDCVGLLAGIARNTNALTNFEFEANYRRHQTGEKMVELFVENMNIIDPADVLPADVFALRYSKDHWHCMFVRAREGDEITVIEADRKIVTRHRIDESHKRRIHSAYRLRSLTNE